MRPTPRSAQPRRMIRADQWLAFSTSGPPRPVSTLSVMRSLHVDWDDHARRRKQCRPCPGDTGWHLISNQQAVSRSLSMDSGLTRLRRQILCILFRSSCVVLVKASFLFRPIQVSQQDTRHTWPVLALLIRCPWRQGCEGGLTRTEPTVNFPTSVSYQYAPKNEHGYCGETRGRGEDGSISVRQMRREEMLWYRCGRIQVELPRRLPLTSHRDYNTRSHDSVISNGCAKHCYLLYA